MKSAMTVGAVAVVLASGGLFAAEPPRMKMSTEIPVGISTADKVETRVGTFALRDGIPDQDSIENIYDYTYAIEALKIGEPVQIIVLRGGKQLKLEVTPGSRD